MGLRKYDLCMLDMDGTLFDYEAAERACIKNAGADIGIDLDDRAIKIYRRINEKLWLANERGEMDIDRLRTARFEQLFDKIGVDADALSINDFYMSRLSKDARIIPGAEEFCKKLKELGYITCAVTNGFHENQVSRLALSDISSYIDELVTSQEAGAAKPHPEIFSLAMKKCGINDKERAVMVGDRLIADVSGGLKFGIDSIWLNFLEQSSNGDIKPTATATNFDELISILCK